MRIGEPGLPREEAEDRCLVIGLKNNRHMHLRSLASEGQVQEGHPDPCQSGTPDPGPEAADHHVVP